MTRRITMAAGIMLFASALDVWGQTFSARGGLTAVLPEVVGLREGDKDALLGLFQAQTTTFPIGSSAGGFTWSFDPQLGVPARRSRSFGPMFAERALTTGRHRLSLSLGYQRTQWKAIAGQNLDEGLPFTFWHIFNLEWVEVRSRFKLTTEQTVLTATFGVFDRVDVGVRLPYVRQTVSGTLEGDGPRCNGCGGGPFLENYSGESVGLGDITIRGKVSLPVAGMDLAAAGDVRLPTGNDRQLLGAGNTQITGMLIGGGRHGYISTHFNFGYTFAGPGLAYETQLEQGDFHPSDELKYTVGAEFTVSTPVTIAGDVIGRSMFKAGQPFMYSNLSGDNAGLRIQRQTVNLLLGAVSAKYMVSNMWLLTVAVAFPLNDNGIKPGITPVIGFERAF